MITRILVALAAIALVASLWDLIRSPTIRRVATRSILRRPAEALLIVGGSMFGTAIIGAALIVGDSFTDSIRDVARTELGPLDIRVTIRPTTDLTKSAADLADELKSAHLAHVDGILPAVTADAVIDNGRRDSLQSIISDGCIAELDFDAARRFGTDEAITGLASAGPTPGKGSAVISAGTASRLRLKVGDNVAIHVVGETVEPRVRTIVPTVGLAGNCDVLVAPGTIDAAWSKAAKTEPRPVVPATKVLISLDGGVFDSTTHSKNVVAAIDNALRDSKWHEATTSPVKTERLRIAQERGDNLRTIFSGIGGFSVISGILLLVNLVIMLAEERKVELGILRAIGMKRRVLIRNFSLEGSIYAAASSVVGAVVAAGIASLIIFGTRQIFDDPGRRFTTSLFLHPQTLLSSAAIGYVISMVTIWLASARIARLNIIAAIRDLPEHRGRTHRRIALATSVFVTAAGVATSIIGIRTGAQIPLMCGVPIAAFAATRLAPRIRALPVVLSSISIAWILGVFVLFSEQMDHASIAVFVVMGVLLVASAVVSAVALAPTIGRSVRGARGQWGLAGRLGFAYPLAHAVRTGLLLAMFSLVIFTMTFISSIASTIDGQAKSGGRDMSAGFDLLVQSNAGHPLRASDIVALKGVARASELTVGYPEFTIRYEKGGKYWPLTGFDASFLAHGAPRLTEHQSQFGSDRETFQAVLKDPTLIIVDDRFLLSDTGPKEDGPAPGDRVTVTNGHDTLQLTVAGVLSGDYAGLGSLTSKSVVNDLLKPAVSSRYTFAQLDPGIDPTTAARSMNAQLVSTGAEVLTFPTLVSQALDDTTSFMRLLEVYLAFGLLIGIAGLGVVMVRAARERRREIAMLRAMGFGAKVIYRSFLIEAFFIASQATLIGVSLALLTSYQVIINSSAFSLSADSFVVSWPSIAIIAIVPIGAALLAAVQPARAASRISPAVALRVSD